MTYFSDTTPRLMAWDRQAPSRAFQPSGEPGIPQQTASDAHGITTASDKRKTDRYDGRAIADSVATPALGGRCSAACTHAAGPYNYQTSFILGISVHTNNRRCRRIPRLWRTTQTVLPRKQPESPRWGWLAFRHGNPVTKNAIRPGHVLPNGQIADGTALWRVPRSHSGRLTIQSLRVYRLRV